MFGLAQPGQTKHSITKKKMSTALPKAVTASNLQPSYVIAKERMMPTLRVKYRTFDGFERAITAQTAHFSALRPDVGFELSHGGPEEIYAEMVEHGGATDGRYDVMLTLTD